MAGYRDDPSATAQAMTSDGWLRTGDKVEISGNGEIFYGGRLKSVINRGGEKVHPEAIEEVVGSVPWVRGVVAAGVPDEVLGERIVCVVEAAEADFIESDLRSVAAARLGSHLRPDSYVRVDALPRTPTGKLRRAEAELLAV
jgi:acyl-CoA synthetase (AMP-forming)/AMP-acid ligase II